MQLDPDNYRRFKKIDLDGEINAYAVKMYTYNSIGGFFISVGSMQTVSPSDYSSKLLEELSSPIHQITLPSGDFITSWTSLYTNAQTVTIPIPSEASANKISTYTEPSRFTYKSY